VRTLFLRHLADRLACPVGALSIEDGRFMRAGRHVGQDYWSIARDIDLARPAAADAAPKPPSNYRIVGQSLPRLDLADKVAQLIHEGNVRRIIIKDEHGHTFMEIPLTVATAGVILAPILAALGAIATLVAKFDVVVERSTHAAPPARSAEAEDKSGG